MGFYFSEGEKQMEISALLIVGGIVGAVVGGIVWGRDVAILGILVAVLGLVIIVLQS